MATRESLEHWKEDISRLTHSLLRATETFFYRKSLVLERIVETKAVGAFLNRPRLSRPIPSPTQTKNGSAPCSRR